MTIRFERRTTITADSILNGSRVPQLAALLTAIKKTRNKRRKRVRKFIRRSIVLGYDCVEDAVSKSILIFSFLSASYSAGKHSFVVGHGCFQQWRAFVSDALGNCDFSMKNS